MKTILLLALFVYIENCSGKNLFDRFFRYKPRLPFEKSKLFDKECKNDPRYEDDCPKMAAIENYCQDQADFMKAHCPENCGFCSKGTQKPPAPAVCEDDPYYADKCPEKAAVEGYCLDQKAFMEKNCRKSCGFCSQGSQKPPAPVVCEDDPNYADKCSEKAAIENYCKDQEDFMKNACPKSCGFCS